MGRAKGSDATGYWQRYAELCDNDVAVYKGEDIAQSTFSGWRERLVFPPAEKACIIAQKLNTTVEWMVTGDETFRYRTGKIPAPIQSLCFEILSLQETRIVELKEMVRLWRDLDSKRVTAIL